jgi:hypothetical protein
VSWGQGREAILRLLDERSLEMVPADIELSMRIIDTAVTHVATARREAELDPVMAYTALYDASRKALTALLQTQGLRPTRTGGHLAVFEACRAQLDPPLGAIIRPLDRMRRTRHAAEYPDSSTMITTVDVLADLPKAEAIIDAAQRLVERLPVFARQPASSG